MSDQEMKARFFSLHLGSTIEDTNGEYKGPCLGVDLTLLRVRCDSFVWGTDWVSIQPLKIVLTPLSEITDEDAIAALSPIAAGEIGFEEFREMINGGDKKANPNWKVKVEKYDKADDGYWLVEIRLTEDTYIVLYDDGTLLYHWNGETRPVDNSGFVFDFLRSKSYCLPFMGKNPFTEGWAVPATVNQPQGTKSAQ